MIIQKHITTKQSTTVNLQFYVQKEEEITFLLQFDIFHAFK